MATEWRRVGTRYAPRLGIDLHRRDTSGAEATKLMFVPQIVLIYLFMAPSKATAVGCNISSAMRTAQSSSRVNKQIDHAAASVPQMEPFTRTASTVSNRHNAIERHTSVHWQAICLAMSPWPVVRRAVGAFAERVASWAHRALITLMFLLHQHNRAQFGRIEKFEVFFAMQHSPLCSGFYSSGVNLKAKFIYNNTKRATSTAHYAASMAN